MHVFAAVGLACDSDTRSARNESGGDAAAVQSGFAAMGSDSVNDRMNRDLLVSRHPALLWF
jgi:hypothetical protein